MHLEKTIEAFLAILNTSIVFFGVSRYFLLWEIRLSSGVITYIAGSRSLIINLFMNEFSESISMFGC